MADKHERFRKILIEVTEQIEKIESQTLPLRAERDKLAATIAPVEDQMRKIAKLVKALENPESGPSLGELKNDLAAAHRALGARSITAEMGEIGAEVQAGA